MRSFCLNTALAVASLLAAGALPSRAEVMTFVQIQVPFAFEVGSVSLPAGNYEIVQPHESSAVIIRGAGGASSVAAIVSPLHEGVGHNASFLHVGGNTICPASRWAMDRWSPCPLLT
jgi:hypothetical protein